MDSWVNYFIFECLRRDVFYAVPWRFQSILQIYKEHVQNSTSSNILKL